MIQLFESQDEENEKPQLSLEMSQVRIVKNLIGMALWFVISMNVTLWSRDSDNRNWAYLALLVTKGGLIARAIARGGKEGFSQGISTGVSTIAGAIAGGL